MLKKLTMMMVAAAALAGCGNSLHQQTNVSSASDIDGCAPTEFPGASGYVVEGFGGKGETQLIVTERRAVQRCVSGSPAKGATLAAVE